MIDSLTIQKALAAAGLYRGALDGLFGEQSRAARDAALIAAKVDIAAWPHSRRMIAIKQWVLAQAKLKPGKIDGIDGPATRAAEYAFVTPTLKAKDKLPWMAEAEKVMGLHEVMNHDELAAWLRSDNRTAGDPRKIPWCGDFVATCFTLALPDLQLPANPYAARNWQNWGEDATSRYGAAVVFWRGKREGWQGHIGFAAAVDEAKRLILIVGGNQGNEASRAWLGMDRILAWRAPPGWADKMPLIGKTAAGAANISTNEE